jgi:DNA-binding XRE family transcriptional regulator
MARYDRLRLVGATMSRRTALPASSFTDFGSLLRVLRLRARLTQRQLGMAVGYSEAQISRLEQGKRMPDPVLDEMPAWQASRRRPLPRWSVR